MRKAFIVISIFTFLLLAGYLLLNKNSNSSLEVKQVVSPTMIPDGDDRKVVLGVFEGNIPCADCERIKMRLTLYQDPTTLGAAGYTLDQVYVGRIDTPISEQGTWDYLRGNDQDPNATIYGLNLDKPEPERMYFLKVGETAVQMLDPQMNPIQSKLNYTLKKVSS